MRSVAEIRDSARPADEPIRPAEDSGVHMGVRRSPGRMGNQPLAGLGPGRTIRAPMRKRSRAGHPCSRNPTVKVDALSRSRVSSKIDPADHPAPEIENFAEIRRSVNTGRLKHRSPNC